MSTKKKIIIFSAAVLIVLAIMVVTACSQMRNEEEGVVPYPVLENANTAEPNFNTNNPQSETVIEDIVTDKDTGATIEYVEEDTGMTPEEQERYEGRSGANDGADDMKLANINQKEASRIAQDFLSRFCTFNADTLKTNAYKGSWASYVTITADAGTLLQQHLNDTWASNSATYDKIYSALTSSEVRSVYVSHASHEDVVAVSIKAIIDENQGNPGEMDWEIVNTNQVNFAVYLNSDLQVIDVRRQDAKTLNTNIFNYTSTSPLQ